MKFQVNLKHGYCQMIKGYFNIKLLIFISPLLLVIIWFRDGLMMATAESGFPFYNLEYMQEISGHSWTTTNLGNAMGIRVASYPTYSSLAFFEKLGIPNFLIQAGFFYLIFVSAGLGIFYFTKSLFSKIEEKHAFLAVLFYWFNPISIVSVWNRFLNNYMVFWALLPVASYLFYKGLRGKKYKYALLTSLSTVVFSYALTSPVFSILLWGVFTYFTLFFIIIAKKFKFYITYFVLTLVTFILFNFWWLSSFFIYLNSADFQVASEVFLSSNGNLSTLNAMSNLSGKYIYTTRLLEQVFFNEYGPPWFRLFLNPVFVFFQLILSGSVFYIILKYRKKFNVLLLGLLLSISLFLIKGSNPPLGEVFTYLFNKSLVFQGFRNPFEKFSFLLPLTMSPLLAFSIHSLRRSKLSLSRNIYFSVFTLALALYATPFLTMNVFEYYRGESVSYKVEAPGYYREANQWLMNESYETRFVSLPIANEGITYDWPHNYNGVELSSTLYQTPNISYNTTIPFYSEVVDQMILDQTGESLINYMPFTSSRYILLRHDIDFKQRSLPDPATLEKLVNTLPEVEHDINFDKLGIYSLDKKYVWPKIYTTENIVYSNSVDLGNITNSLVNFPDSKYVIVSERNQQVHPEIYNNLYLVPDDFFRPKVLSKAELSDEDIFAKLFYVKHLPNSNIYPLVRIKEVLEKPPSSDYQGTLIYEIGLLGKRAVEIYKLNQLGVEKEIVQRYEKEYLDILENHKAKFTDISKKDTPVSKLLVDSLVYQLQLLQRANLDGTTYLNNMLVDMSVKPKYEFDEPEEGEIIVYNIEVPINGNYLVNADHAFIEAYLNGEVVKNNSVFLQKGKYELALVFDQELVRKRIIESKPFHIDKIDNTHEESWQSDGTQKDYELSFDILFSEGNIFAFDVIQNIDDEREPLSRNTVSKDPDYHGSKAINLSFSTKVGATSTRLKFHNVDREDDKCSFFSKLLAGECETEENSIDLKVDNLELVERITPQVYLTGEDFLETTDYSSSQIKWSKESGNIYKVDFLKSDNRPEFVTFLELFDSNWQLKSVNHDEVGHYLVNGYANGWLFDKAGEYSFSIIYRPEDYLDMAKVASLISILLGLVFYFSLKHD